MISNDGKNGDGHEFIVRIATYTDASEVFAAVKDWFPPYGNDPAPRIEVEQVY